MRPSEVTRFQRAFYSVWAIGFMTATPHLHDRAVAYLDNCGPREVCKLNELATWAIYYNDNDFGSVSMDLRDENGRAAYELLSDRWVAYQQTGRGLTIPDYTPFNFFAFFDHTQRYLDLISEDGN